MTREELLLTQLSEECAEVIQSVSKCLRFGNKEVYHKGTLTNAERLSEELDDVIGVFTMLIAEGVLRAPDDESVKAKKAKVEHFMEYSLSIPNSKNK